MGVIRAVVLDFDGVLVESVGVKTAAFAALFEPEGPEVVRQVIAHHLAHGGLSRFDKFEHIYREILRRKLTPEERERLAARFSELVEEAVVVAPWVRGAPAFLVQAATRWSLYVASATPQAELERIVRHRNVAQYFSGVFGSPASKVDILRRVLAEQPLEPRQMVLIGDADSDYASAQHVGCGFIGRVPPDALSRFPADVATIPDLRSLQAKLEAWSG